MIIPFPKDDEATQDFLAKQESQHVERPSLFKDKVKDRIRLGIQHYGDPMPWNKTHNKIRFRPGETTIWSGINGHGKSQICGMTMLWLATKTPVLIASLEMTPEATLDRMTRQASGNANPSDEFIDQFFTRVDDTLLIYDQLDTVPAERILAAMHWAATKYGVKHIMLDSLMKCGIAEDDYPGQAAFIDRLSWAAKRYQIHIHLVAHMRKGHDEETPGNKFSISGSGNISNLVDNVLLIHRNKRKERIVRKAEDFNEDASEVADEPDCSMTVAKQRHGEWEGVFYFWFHQPSMQYTPENKNSPMRWTGL